MVALTAMRGLCPLVALAAIFPLLILAPPAAADDSSSRTDPICIGNVDLLKFHSFRWQANRNDSMSADTFVMQVMANTTCYGDTTPVRIPLTDVSLVYTSATQTLVNVVGSGSFLSPSYTFYFPIASNTINFTEEVYYVISATLDVAEKQAGKALLPIHMNGAAKFSMTVPPSVIKAHYLQPLNLTRLSNTRNISLDICTLESYGEEACYFPTDGQGDFDVCVKQTCFDQSECDGFILICDDTVEAVTVNETTRLDSVQLLSLSPDGVVTFTLTNQDTTLEVYQYFDDGTYENGTICDTFDGTSNCSLTSYEPSNESFLFRMVELDGNGSPTSSNEVHVQDFNVTTSGISSDTAQVSWNSDNGGEFEVTISPPNATFSGRVVNCTEPLCDFFFIGLQGDWSEYKIAVRRVGDDSPSEVVTWLGAAPDDITNDGLNITRLKHYTDDNYRSIQTEACFEYKSDESISARLLLIDSTGLFVQSSESGLNDNEVNNTYCLNSVEVPGEFLKSQQTRVMVDIKTGDRTSSKQTDIFLFVPDIQQVSNASARVTWRNLNFAEFFTSRAPGYGSNDEQQALECSYTGELCHYYVNEDEQGRGNFSLLETSEKLDQFSTVRLEMKNIAKGLQIYTPFSVRHDDSLQVCFDAVPEVDHYELGIQLLGELVSSNQNAKTEMVSGKTCAISSEPVSLGAYEDLWAVVVAYDASGSILSAGEVQYEDTFLSPNRFVLAVTSGSTSPVSLRASWYILDNDESFKLYNIYLVDEKGAGPPKVVIIPETTTDFSITEDGLYSVCVSVTNPSGSQSEQTCSDIITIEFETESKPPPEVANVKRFYTSDKKVKVTWDRPEDASALLVSWREDKTKLSVRNGRSLPSIETARNQAFFTQRNTDALESFPRGSAISAFSSWKADIPLPQARSIQDINDQMSRVLLPNITGDGFTLVPASQSSLDIPITKGTWNICVSAVRNHKAGKDSCLIYTYDDSDAVPSPPTGLTITDDGVLSWTGPQDPLVEEYYLELDRGAESLSHTTNLTNLPLVGLVEAGQWGVAVHSVVDGRLSEGLTTVVVVNGIKVTYEQTGSRDVTLSWEETSKSSVDNELTYSVTLGDVTSVDTTCSRDNGCSVTFSDVEANASQVLDVIVESKNNPGMKETIQIFFLDIGIVPANQLQRLINGNGSATVTWDCLADISFYNISLVDKNDVVLINDQQTVPCSYTFAETTLTTLQEDYVLLQACLNSPGVVRCGDPQKILLGPDVPGPTTETSNVLVIVLASVAAGLLLILMVAGIVYKLRSDRAKRPTGEDTSNDGGSVHSLKGSSGSQHSVEPPAQNPSPTAVQRQTPVQYRSAAPVSQTQNPNGTLELSLRARQNPAVARAPISSVNPNVRYDGPAQRNVPSNTGPQRLPQVGNPPPQRFYAPRTLAANPNVRAAGPLRMNAPAGQPRMNSVPSGPNNYSGQPRNLPQSARMNRPPNSQPIEVLGRFSGAPIATRPTNMSPTRAPAPRATGYQMSAPPARYPPPGQRSAPGPSSPTRIQAPSSGLRPIPRVGGGGGGYVDMTPSAPGPRQTRPDARQFSPERFVRQPQPQNPRGQVRTDINRPNYNERVF